MTAQRKNNYVQRNGLLVPETIKLRDDLAQQRHATAITREDKEARLAGRAHHRNRLAQIAEKATAARRARRARKRDLREQASLNRLYQVAVRSGTRARIRADINRSAEMRALRVNKVRSITLIAGIPVLSAFAAWSTAGAQAGAVRLLGLHDGTFFWRAAWGVEPALITIVGAIIIGKAVLRASGGDVDWRASAIEWAALGTSLGLNIFGGWEGGWWGVKTVLPHAIGPTFCALTALLIGLFVGYAADAKPWDGAPRLTDMGFVADQDTTSARVVDASVGDELADIAQLPQTDTPAVGDVSGLSPDTGRDDEGLADTDAPESVGGETGQDASSVAEAPSGRASRRAARRTPDRTSQWTKEQLKAFRLRDSRAMTYPEIAQEVGVSEKTVSRWFRKREEASAPDTDMPDGKPERPAVPPTFDLPKPDVVSPVNGSTYPTGDN